MNIKKIAIAGLLCAMTAMSLAQGGGGGRQGFGRGGMMGGGGMMSGAMLLNRDDVQKDLALTDDQKSKLSEMRTKMREDMQAAMQDAQGDREAMGKIFTKMQEKANAELKTILTADQLKRLKEIGIQMSGNRAVTDKDLQKELGITDAQKAKIEALVKAQGDANRAVFEKMRNKEITREEVRPIMEKNNKALDDEIGKVLTAAQKDKLKAMAGKKFEKEEDKQG